MTLKQYLLLMTIGTVLCWVAWGFVLFNVNPEQTDAGGRLFFYASLFLAVVGSFSVVGFLLRRAILQNDELVFRHVRHTFRQSVLVAAFLVGSLLLIEKDAMSWWLGIVLMLAFVGLEGVVFTGRKFKNADLRGL